MTILKKILILITLSTIGNPSYSAIPEHRDPGVVVQLRKAIMDDDQLSTSAHNIQILTEKNSIILKGRVASRAEKVKIENLARARAGNKRVYNRLTY